ncbi:hypothetical protein [Streptomyces sp. NBC_01718]|uniref:hypothetical protein n=1 Tax=Streptomyces sp. NBC_01718 TaxID=2975919 RepID=UPI00352EE30F
MRRWTPAEFLLEHRELGISDSRGVRRTRRAQPLHATLAPGTPQRSTDRTLTRRSFAITAVLSPAANLSPA